MPVEIGEIVTEVVVEPPAAGEAPTVDPEQLRELVLHLLREELERRERLGEGR